MLDPRALVHVALTAQFGYPGAKTCFGWFFSFRRQLYLAKDSIVDSQGEQRPLGFFGSKLLALMWRFSLDAACHSDANPLGQDIFSLLKMTMEICLDDESCMTFLSPLAPGLTLPLVPLLESISRKLSKLRVSSCGWEAVLWQSQWCLSSETQWAAICVTKECGNSNTF